MSEKPVIAVWMRITLIVTGILNMFGAALFFPAFQSLRISNNLPLESHPLYLAIISSWIFLFGLCYLWLGITGRNERLFLIIGAAGKLAFVILMFAYCATGQIPIGTALSSLPDLLFAIVFGIWLWETRNSKRYSKSNE
jgi:uncharacterized membrane protein